MEHLKYMIYAAMFSEAVLLIMPSGSMKKYVKLAAGILITLLMIAPLSTCSMGDIPGMGTLKDEDTLTAGEIITEAYMDHIENMD